jgi:phytol kinase
VIAPIVADPVAGLAIAGGAFGALLGGLGALQRRRTFAPEFARKLFHTGMGLVALTLPLLFATTWPVLVLCASAAAILGIVRWNRPANGTFGAVLHAVDRTSYGEFCFAAATAVAFAAYHDRPLLYEIPMATLAFADSAAALVGSRLGRRRYRTVDGRKSLEGSLAFFAVAFECALVPLLATHATGNAAAVLVAIVFASMATWMEATCWRGGDNLGIPLVGGGVLAEFVREPLATLALQTGVLVALVVAVLVVRRRTTLGIDAVMAALFFGYTFWAWGGIAYLVPPAILFAVDAFPGRCRSARAGRPHRASAVVATCAPGLAWAFAAQIAHDRGLAVGGDVLYAGYLASFSAALGIFQFTIRGRRIAAGCIAALACAPVAFVVARDPVLAAIVLVTTIAATAFFAALQPRAFPDCPRDGGRWWRQGLLSTGFSLGAFALFTLTRG